MQCWSTVLCGKGIYKDTTNELLPDIGLKGQFTKKLKKHSTSGLLTLDLKHQKALIDHIPTAPEIFIMVMTNHNVNKSFVINGMADTLTKTYPDFKAIMNTCKRNITLEEEKLVIESFPNV